MRKNNPTLQSILLHLAQEAALPGEINLWPEIQSRLAKSQAYAQKRTPSINPNQAKEKKLRVAAVVVIFLLIFTAFLFTTPTGRAWAKQIWQFFSRAESDRLPVPMERLADLPSLTFTPAPTYSLPLEVPSNVSEEPTGTPRPTFISPPVVPSGDAVEVPSPTPIVHWIPIEEADTQAGFDVLEPGYVPQGFTLQGVEYRPELGLIGQMYRHMLPQGVDIRSQPGFEIIQMQVESFHHCALSEKCSYNGKVGPSATVEPVYIDGQSGEYVRGGWIWKPTSTYGNSTIDTPQYTWDSNPHPMMETLAWQAGGIRFTIFAIGGVGEDEILKIAGGLMSSSSDNSPPTFTKVPNLELQEIQKQVPFVIHLPAILPPEFSLIETRYSSGNERALIRYANETGTGSYATLTIYQAPTGSTAEFTLNNLPPDVIDLVQVGKKKGLYVADLINLSNEATPFVGSSSPTYHLLSWEADGLMYEMTFFAPPDYAGRLELPAMIAIANSMIAEQEIESPTPR